MAAIAGKLTVEVVSASIGDKEGSKLWQKLSAASVKLELREGVDLQKGKTKQVDKKDNPAGGYIINYGETLDFDVKEGFPGELRVQLCRTKTSALNAGGTVPIANAGIFVAKIITYIQKEKKAINKAFSLYAQDSGSAGGSVLLKLNFIPKGSSAPLGAVASPRKSSTGTTAAPAEPDAPVDLGEHAAAAAEDTAEMHVTTVKAHGHGPPLMLLAGVALVVLGGVVAMMGGAGGAPPPPPPVKGRKPPPPPKGKNKK